MLSSNSRRAFGRHLLAATFGVCLLAAAVPGHAQARPPAPSCATPEYHQFDFFVGDWDTYDVSDSTKIVARNRVTPMVGGCAVREVYEQGDGLRGESFSTYDHSRGVWHQSWVTNHAQLLLMDGGLVSGNMVFTTTTKSDNGTTSLLRVTWIPQHPSVRETAESSSDGGKSWTSLFDIVFRPHK